MIKKYLINIFFATFLCFLFGCIKDNKAKSLDPIFLDTPYWVFSRKNYEGALKELNLIKNLNAAVNKRIVIVGCATYENNKPTLIITFNSQTISILISNLQDWELKNKPSHRSLVLLEGKLGITFDGKYFIELSKYSWIDS